MLRMPRPIGDGFIYHASWTGRVAEDLMEIYLIVIGRTATGYSAHCPDVLGCAAAGKTVEAVVAKMKEALELHFEGMVEDGDAIPKPRGLDSYREVMKDLGLNEHFLAHVQIDTSRFAAPISRP
jgi:predicted RNase H-like HicB family nuclease